ncbi:hypothetical protein [Massilia sp. ST3]|uniref:hypothetical protein n=1 Tax=Massilia sp. ST3 TaxID=2824903 RepID=UPI001B82DD43|nr:hypothetical protein [Massilia sp. ST3]MBQ5947452.1 hypothetical protein [Massilia sp. ST3]
MRSMIFAALVALAGAAGAQNLTAPATLPPAQGQVQGYTDPAPAGMIAETPGAGSFQQWYVGQRRPAMVVYFDRKLEQLPPGWQGRDRLLVEETTKAQGKEENRRLTVGFERNTAQAARPVSQFAQLFQNALEAELKRQSLRVLDGKVLHRKEAAGGRGGDIEYSSLKGAARFVFEVELLVLNGEWELVGVLKDIRNGDLTASVRLPVENLGNHAAIERAARSLVRRLMHYSVA